MVPWPDRNASGHELRNYDGDHPGAGPEGKTLLRSQETCVTCNFCCLYELLLSMAIRERTNDLMTC